MQEDVEKDFVDYMDVQLSQCSLDEKDITPGGCQALFSSNATDNEKNWT